MYLQRGRSHGGGWEGPLGVGVHTHAVVWFGAGLTSCQGALRVQAAWRVPNHELQPTAFGRW